LQQQVVVFAHCEVAGVRTRHPLYARERSRFEGENYAAMHGQLLYI